LIYAVVGVACAIAVLRRAPTRGAAAFASALATIPLWPLWAPFALAPARERRVPSTATITRVEKALAEAVDAVADTPMGQMFSRREAARIVAEVARIANRHADLSALADRAGFDREASARRLAELERAGASDRAVTTARLQHESLERLAELRIADARALDEIADLVEALRTQLVLARYAGSSADGASALVTEVWARLEGLGAVIDPTFTEAARSSR
jgi:hypothetical protein